MKRSDFKNIGTRTISGKRVKIAEGVNVRFFRIGTCNVQASTLDAAIAKYVECQAKREASTR